MRLKETRADLAYWEELAKLVPGWKVMGWTYRQSATYITIGHWGPYHTDTVALTGRQRDDLVNALHGTVIADIDY